MRWPLYAWSDGQRMHIWVRSDLDADDFTSEPDDLESFLCGIGFPDALFDQLVVARFAELAVSGALAGVLAEALASSSPMEGNFGGEALRVLASSPNEAGEMVAAALAGVVVD